MKAKKNNYENKLKNNNYQNNIKGIFLTLFIMVMTIAMTGFAFASPSPINLGTAGNYVILAETAITTTGTTEIIGNIGISPAAQSYITGFSETLDATNQFATASIVTGKIYASDMAPPTPTIMTTAISDMKIAYTDATSRAVDVTELGAGDISGLTIKPGVYKWGTGVLITSDVTLSGSSTDIFIFQIAQDLTVSNGVNVHLSGGAQAKNVFWQVAGQATLGTTAHFEGNILSQTAIDLQTGATINGRLLAQTAVTLDANTITKVGTASATSSGSNDDESSDSGSDSDSENCMTNWICTDWNDCSSSGTQTRNCYYPTNKCEPETNKPAERRSCNYVSPEDIIEDDTSDDDTNLEIIKDETYKGTSYSNPIVKTLNDGFKEIKYQGISANTKLDLTLETDDQNKVHLWTNYANGKRTEVKVMPQRASEIALERLRLKVCNEQNNCTIELKEVGVGAEVKIVYKLKAEKHVKVLGLFKAKMHVETQIDANTGEVVSTKQPWWRFMAVSV